MHDPLRKRIRLIHQCCIAGVVVVLGVAAALAVWPMVTRGRDNIAMANGIRKELKQLDGLTVKTQEVQARISAIEKEITQEERRLPTRNQMDQFLNELSKVAADSGVSIQGFDKSPIETSGDFRRLPARIVASGSYAQCYKFLAGIRKMERLTQLENAGIEAEQKTDEGSKPGEKACRLTVSIATFMAK